MIPDLAGFPECPEPRGIHRILEHLPDKGPSHVRYESAQGVMTGQQIGRYVVRDQLLEMEVRRLCIVCPKPTLRRGTMAVAIDCLDKADPIMCAVRRDHALAYADELSRCHGATGEFLPWICKQMHRGYDGKDPQPFRVWRALQDSVRESAESDTNGQADSADTGDG